MRKPRWNKATEMSSSGSIIGSMKVRGAILLAYDTRTHKKGTVFRKWDAEENDFVEVVNNKVHLAQYCALAAAGNRGFGAKLHRRLLQMITKDLVHPSGPRQVKAKAAMRFLKKQILAELRNPATDESHADYLVSSCRLILGIWEMDTEGEFTPIILSLDKDQVVRDVEYCVLGNYCHIAQAILDEKYRENMSVKEGKDLLVQAMLESCFKDHRGVLGGYIEVLVLFPRDYTLLPLPRGQQYLDRAITFFRAAKIPEEREQPEAAATLVMEEEREQPEAAVTHAMEE